MTVGQALREITLKLREANSPSPEAEATALLSYAWPRILGQTSPEALSVPVQISIPRSELLVRRDEALDSRVKTLVFDWLTEMLNGRPLQYVTGYQFFLEHEYAVNEHVLIPRPETEGLVRLVEAEFSQLQSAGAPPWFGLELGLGSGIISLELLAHFPSLQMIGSEISTGAKAVTEINAARILGPDFASRLKVLKVEDSATSSHPQGAEIFQSVVDCTGRADFLVSNPPYLEGAEEAEGSTADHEPGLALFAPPGDALFFYRDIAEHAISLLRPEGVVFVEIASERGPQTAKCFENFGWSIELRQDLTGRDRYLIARRKGA